MGGEAAEDAEAQNLSVTHGCGEGRWAKKEGSILPGEEPSDLGRCNYDTERPKRSRDVTGMDRGLADEVVVVVKLGANEGMVTCQRIKHLESARGKKNPARRRTEHESDCEIPQQTTVERSAERACSNLGT